MSNFFPPEVLSFLLRHWAQARVTGSPDTNQVPVDVGLQLFLWVSFHLT